MIDESILEAKRYRGGGERHREVLAAGIERQRVGIESRRGWRVDERLEMYYRGRG
mgnify:FL=1